MTEPPFPNSLATLEPAVSNRKLCEALMQADSEDEVERLLSEAGYWEDRAAWLDFGGNANNSSTICNQQATPEAALVEKIVNSIDARMMDACRAQGLDPSASEQLPQSGREAIARWLPHGMNTDDIDIAGNVAAWPKPKIDEQAEQITVAATGSISSDACITISDTGEGQEPDAFKDTFCALSSGNKRSVPFVQGKHTMGGTGAFRFCGANSTHAHNLQLVVSRRNPVYAIHREHTPWGFTVMRRFQPEGTERTATYRYLAPGGRVLRFPGDKPLGMFPRTGEQWKRAEPYGKTASYGTLTKLYEYIQKTYITKSSSPTTPTLLRHLELLIPASMLPVKLYECRDFKRSAEAHPSIPLTGITNRLANLDAPEETLEWGRDPKTVTFTVDKQPFAVSIWAFRKPANRWRRGHGVLFTLNGQTHAILPDRFFGRQSVGLDVLRKSLLVVVDCSRISPQHESDLLMTSRDRLSQSVFAKNVEAELAQALKDHSALRELRNQRSSYDGPVDEEAKKTLLEHIAASLNDNPALAAYLVDGTDIPNPFPPTPEPAPPPTLYDFPTFFRLRKSHDHHLNQTAPLGRDYYRFLFVTDVRDNYFNRPDPGEWFLDIRGQDDSWHSAQHLVKRWQLNGGVGEMRIALPEGASPGDVIELRFVVEDTNPKTSDFVNTITLTVAPPAKTKPGPPSKPRPPSISPPEITSVKKEDWDKQHPEPFDQFTALRKVDLEDGAYEFRYNADNKWLKAAIKHTPESKVPPTVLQTRFASIMAALGMAVLVAHGRADYSNGTEPNGEHHSDDSNGILNGNVNDYVDWISRAVAPVVASIHSFTNTPQHANNE